ncbi:MAG: MFS transporter [Clostridiales Family XIII bacterium]|nr:MFS transporter [Clostridiales Family XIII bacterium]
MSTQNNKPTVPKIMTNLNFGRFGWMFVIYYFIALLFNVGITADGTNLLVPRFSQDRGMEAADLLVAASIAGYISLVAYVVFMFWIKKTGGRIPATVMYIVSGVFFIIYGQSQNFVFYVATYTVTVAFLNGLTWSACANMASEWFPRKKGLVMGIVTIGNNAVSIVFLPMLAFLLNRIGISGATMVFGIVMIVIGAGGHFMIRNRPEDIGLHPDNITPQQEKENGLPPISELISADRAGVWTMGQILTKKEFWIIAVTTALCYLGSGLGMMQQIVRLREFGYTENEALLINAIFVGGVGIVGSYLWGVIDQKRGTRKAVMIYAASYAVGFFLNVMAGMVENGIPIIMVSVALMGFCLGGSANWPVSLTASLWGRRDFITAFTPLNIISIVGRMSCFALIAFTMKLSNGTLQGSYIAGGLVFIVVFVLISTLNIPKFVEKYPLNQ